MSPIAHHEIHRAANRYISTRRRRSCPIFLPRPGNRGADGVHERGVLEQDDALREQQRHHVAEGLRQDHVAHGLGVSHAHGVPSRDLTARNALDAGADDLAVVRRLENHERDQRRVERPDRRRLPGIAAMMKGTRK